MKFGCIDAGTLQADGRTYDVVVLVDILEHLDEPYQQLSLCSALLADGGCLLLTIHNGYGPFEFESYIQKIPLLGPAPARLNDLAAAVLDRFIFNGPRKRKTKLEPADLPYNAGSPLVQWYTLSRMKRYLAQANLEVGLQRNLSVLSGPFSNYVFGPFAWAGKANTSVADHLPHWMVSAWWMQVSKVSNGSTLD